MVGSVRYGNILMAGTRCEHVCVSIYVPACGGVSECEQMYRLV